MNKKFLFCEYTVFLMHNFMFDLKKELKSKSKSSFYSTLK